MRSSTWKNANSVTSVPEAMNRAGCRVLTRLGHGDLGITLFSKWKLRPRGEKWPEAHEIGGSRTVGNFWSEEMSFVYQKGERSLSLTPGGSKIRGCP